MEITIKRKDAHCTVYKLPANPQNQQQWLNVIPKEKGSKINIRDCEKHWLNDTQMVKVQGGKSRPSVPPSIFYYVYYSSYALNVI